VATASCLSGEVRLASTSVFDEIDGRWVAVTIGSDRCRDDLAQIWEVLTPQPGPDGTLTGEYRRAASNTCDEKRTATFTRTGDVDTNSLPDHPATLTAAGGVRRPKRYTAATTSSEPSRTGSHNSRKTRLSLPSVYAPAIGA